MSDQLKSRTKQFALDVIRLSASYPKAAEIRHLFSQVLRSSSSVAANYRAACRARSSSEFLAKLGTVEEECDETQFWLELLQEGSGILKLRVTTQQGTELERLMNEADELLRIIIAAKKTVRAKLQK
jgi:four helix bundle protein